MDAHLSEESRESGNRRNGRMSKIVQTQYGEVTVDTPRDRDGSFAPQAVRKRETILAEGMAGQIIGMYAFGTSTCDISQYFESVSSTPACLQQAPKGVPQGSQTRLWCREQGGSRGGAGQS